MPRRRAAYLSEVPRTALDRWGLAAIVALGLGVRLWMLGTSPGFTDESPIYLRMADSLLAGRPANAPAHHGFPTLLAGLAALLPGPEWPGRIVSFIAGLLLIPAAAGLGGRVSAPRWGLLAAGIVALHPAFAAASVAIAPESLFALIATLALLMAESRKYSSAGLWLGLGYVVKPESIAIAPMLALCSRGAVRGFVAVLLAFAAVAVPYMGYLRLERGTWSVVPHETVVAAPEAAAGAAPAADDAGAHEGLIGYLERLKPLGQQIVATWTWPLLLLSVAGLAMAPGPLLAPVLALLLLPLLGVPPEPRFLLPAFVALAAACAAVPPWIEATWPRVERFAPAVALLAVIGLGIAWFGGTVALDALFAARGPREQRQAGEWLRHNGRAGAAVMDKQTYVSYFARMRHVPVPDGSLDAVLDYAVANGVDYVVVEDNVKAFDERLAPLFADGSVRKAEKRLRQVHEVILEPLKGVMVFEVVRDTLGVEPDTTSAALTP